MNMFLKNLNLLIFFKCCRSNHNFVPKHQKANSLDVSLLQNFINVYKNIIILTGAGISTESGLPDYRSEGVGLYDRSPNRPVQFKDFMSKHQIRKSYWARNYIAWGTFSTFQPNDTHNCLANWEKKGIVNCIVTQNVDRLHQKAGSKQVIELHGTSYLIKCMNCGYRTSRQALQKRLIEANSEFHVTSGEIRPDADIDIEPKLLDSFNIVNCEKCDGILKPDVVFFGENVRKELVFDIYNRIEKSNAMLILGSSLEVYSGYRFVLHASEHRKPIGIVNIGSTRGDNLATFKLRNRCGDLLPQIIC